MLCHGTAYSEGRLSLHHVSKHPRDDLRENLVMLCGDGVRGCHGKIEAHDHETIQALNHYLLASRPDVVEHLRSKGVYLSD